MNLDEKFKALSDGTRRKILDLLKEKTMTATEIAEACNSTKPNISQHLKVLKNCGFIQDDKQGLFVYYSLNNIDFNRGKKEVKKLISIKDKIFMELDQIVRQKNCEPVLAGTDSQDDGTLLIMKDSSTILSFQFSFRLSSFVIKFEIPSDIEVMTIDYQDTNSIESFLSTIRDLLNMFVEETKKFTELKAEIFSTLSTQLAIRTKGMSLFGCKDRQIITQLKEWMEEIVVANFPSVPNFEKNQIIEEMLLEITSLGKIHDFLIDSEVSEIMINAPDEIWIERRGRLILSDVKFKDESEIMDLARKIAGHVGRRVDNSNPIVYARLPDGSRVHIILPPIAVKGVTITIRKFFQEKLDIQDLINFGTVTKEASEFLEAAVRSRANIIISGGTGSGKTTTLNIMSNFVPNDNRIVTIEDSLELQLKNDHVVKLETRPANIEGRGEVTTRDLVKASLRMRPERIVIGDIRDGVAFDFMQVCNTGHDGSMGTVHCNSPEHCGERLINLVSHAGFDLPRSHIGELVADAIELIVHVTRLKDGSRKITNISEVIRYESDMDKFILRDIFKFKMDKIEHGKIKGNLIYTGNHISSRLNDKLEKHGYDVEKILITEEHQKLREYLIVQSQLYDVCHSLADGLRAGYTISDVFDKIGDYLDEPFSSEFKTIHTELSCGKTITNAFLSSKERIKNNNYGLLLDCIIATYESGAKLEPTLRSLAKILLEKEQIRHFNGDVEFMELISSYDWKLMEFLEVFSIAVSYSKNVLDALKITYKIIPDTTVKEEIRELVKQLEVGVSFNNAVKNLLKTIDSYNMKTALRGFAMANTFGQPIDSNAKLHADRIRGTFLLKSQLKNREE